MEQEFLQFASHELRSPLAVIRSNTELLKRLQGEHADHPGRVLGRIDEASEEMIRLVETLLWLSRDEAEPQPAEPVDLACIITNLVSELQPQRANKAVSLSQQTEPGQWPLPQNPCRIALANLIANAFQHASGGEIRIVQTGPRVVISNDTSQCHAGERDNIGFGLGLKLVERLAQQYQWTLTTEQHPGRYQITLRFAAEPEHDNR
ncbi:HAMP domain-containing sensor histidine kinase [Ferrimonas pelagia]|uniref:histidine kinase n=1 Tax=Ferrimonas pelagia TaxID=1177826 RepID=A0ABP9FDN7_9GAMM